jgi:hypothetical protein
MSEYPSRSNRRSEISRQFTEEERAVDDRTTAFVDPQRESRPATSYQLGLADYSWMQRDHAMRQMISQNLASERGHAEAQSVRRELGREFEKEASDEADAIEATKEINMFLKNNPEATVNNAVMAVTENRADRWGNEKFISTIENMSKAHETDMQRQKRQSDVEVGLMTNQIAGLGLTARKDFLATPEGSELLKRSAELYEKKSALGFELSEQESLLKIENTKNELWQAKQIASTIDMTDMSLVGKSKLTNFMGKAGIPVTNVVAGGNYLKANPQIVDVISHPTFLTKKPKAHAALAGALAVIQQGDSANSEDKAKAEADIYGVVGSYLEETEGAARILKLEEAAQGFVSETGKSLQDLNKSISAKAARPKKTGNLEGGTATSLGAEVLGETQLWMKSVASSKPGGRLNALYKEYDAKIEKARKSGNDEEQIKWARWIAGDFAMSAAAESVDATPPPSSSLASGSTPSPEKLAKAKEILDRAGGDKNKARKIALEEGF